MNQSRGLLLCALLALSINFVFAKPVTITPVSKTIIPGANANEGFLKVRVTDATGKFASKARVVLTKAYAGKNQLTSGAVDFVAVAGDDTLYQINFLSLKPEGGTYTVEVTATPTEKAWEENDAEFTVRVSASSTISDVQLTISDSTDSIDIQEGRKHSVEFGKTLDTLVKAEYFQHIYLDFKVKGPSGKELQVQQAFVRLFNQKLGREYLAIGKSSTKGYTAHLNLREAANEFYGQSGDYQLQVIVGDASVKNPTVWTVGTVHINYPSELRTEVPRSPFAVLPEIQHQFRKPEKRPPTAISSAFTIAVVAVPALVLFIGLIRVGANLNNFPTGANFIWAIGFQACVGGVLLLYTFYWLSLNMIQTLTYLTVLLIPTLFFAHKNLNALSRGKLHSE